MCRFARSIVSQQTDEVVSLVGHPDRTNRNTKDADELWESPTRQYAVEHTRVEPYDKQLEGVAKTERLLRPLQLRFQGKLPGSFRLPVLHEEMVSVRLRELEVMKRAWATQRAKRAK